MGAPMIRHGVNEQFGEQASTRHRVFAIMVHQVHPSSLKAV